MIETILSRPTVPAPKMGEPGPDDAALDRLLQAAAAAPDHGKLRPWRYLVVRGEARARLGELFAAAAREENPAATEAEIEKQRAAPTRAPLMLVAIARIDDHHPKIPAVEQLLSAGASVQNLLLAAHALGFAAKWSTGRNAYARVVRDGLGLQAQEQIAGLLYLGTPLQPQAPSPRPDVESFTEVWNG